MYPTIYIYYRADNPGQPACGITDVLSDPCERGLGKTGHFFHRFVAKQGGDEGQAAQEVIVQFTKPAAPTVDGGFIGCDGQCGVPGYDRLNAFTAVTFVWDEDIRKFVMYPFTLFTA